MPPYLTVTANSWKLSGGGATVGPVTVTLPTVEKTPIQLTAVSAAPVNLDLLQVMYCQQRNSLPPDDPDRSWLFKVRVAAITSLTTFVSMVEGYAQDPSDMGPQLIQAAQSVLDFSKQVTDSALSGLQPLAVNVNERKQEWTRSVQRTTSGKQGMADMLDRGMSFRPPSGADRAALEEVVQRTRTMAGFDESTIQAMESSHQKDS